MHPAIPKSLLPDQVPSGLQLDDSFRCKPLPWTFYHYNTFPSLGDGILENICMKKIHGGFEKGANLLLAGGFRSKDRVADKDFASDPLFLELPRDKEFATSNTSSYQAFPYECSIASARP